MTYVHPFYGYNTGTVRVSSVQHPSSIRKMRSLKRYRALSVLRAFMRHMYGTIGSPSVVYSTLYMDHDMTILCATRFGWSNHGHSGLSLWWKVRNWTFISAFARKILKELGQLTRIYMRLSSSVSLMVHLLDLELTKMLRVALKSDSEGAMPPSRLMPDTLRTTNLIPPDDRSNMSTWYVVCSSTFYC